MSKLKFGGSKDLTTGNPMKLILNFGVPLLFGMLFQQFYNMVDSVIVGTARCQCPRCRRLDRFHKLYGTWLLHRYMQRLCHPYRTGIWCQRYKPSEKLYCKLCMVFNFICNSSYYYNRYIYKRHTYRYENPGRYF